MPLALPGSALPWLESPGFLAGILPPGLTPTLDPVTDPNFDPIFDPIFDDPSLEPIFDPIWPLGLPPALALGAWVLEGLRVELLLVLLGVVNEESRFLVRRQGHGTKGDATRQRFPPAFPAPRRNPSRTRETREKFTRIRGPNLTRA